jgi:hypothetical protein
MTNNPQHAALRRFKMPDNNVTRVVEAPDGQSIPVPSGDFTLPSGETIFISENASVQVFFREGGYFVGIDSLDHSDGVVEEFLAELAQEAAMAELERLWSSVLSKTALFAAKGGFVILSLLNPSPIGREIFIKGELLDGIPITYCIVING